MSIRTVLPEVSAKLPDHTQLPYTDGLPVENFEQHPQSVLLTDSIGPVLWERHPDGQFVIGQDSGIYWRLTDPPLDGCRAPDWFYVPNRPPRLSGHRRNSYVLWNELVAPHILLEYASGDGSEELDATPEEGKFWVYEQVIRAPYYGVYVLDTRQLLMFRLIDGSYARMEPNERGHYPIHPLGIELGLWQGRYLNLDGVWLRWFDSRGNLLLTGAECAERDRAAREAAERQTAQEHAAKEVAERQAEQERAAKEAAERQTEQAQSQIERLRERLRAAGIDPDANGLT